MNGMDEPVYSLVVMFSNGQVHKVFGDRGSLEPVVDQWAEGALLTRTKIVGFCNTADRARNVFAFNPDDVTAMSVALEF